jgi:undecaprenyl-diphosphatase
MFEDFLHLLGNADIELFETINKRWSNPVFDMIFPLITDLHKVPWVSVLILVTLFYFCYRKFAKWGLGIFLLTAAAVGLADGITGQLLKPFFGRLRPYMTGIELQTRAPVFGQFGFPSNHATNVMCAAILIGYFFPKARWYLLSWAFLIGFSRVYVGAHYPLDVLAGFVFGAALAFICVFIISRFKQIPNGAPVKGSNK